MELRWMCEACGEPAQHACSRIALRRPEERCDEGFGRDDSQFKVEAVQNHGFHAQDLVALVRVVGHVDELIDRRRKGLLVLGC